MEKGQLLAEMAALVASLDDALGSAATIRDDLRRTQNGLDDCWRTERYWIEATIQSLYALGLVAGLPEESLPAGDPLPAGLVARVERLIGACRELSLVQADGL